MRYSRILLIVSVFLSAFIGLNANDLTVNCGVTLKDLSKISDFVFTAKIDSLIADVNRSSNDDKIAIIEVKRLIRASDESYFKNRKVSLKLSSTLFFHDFDLAGKINNCSKKSSYTNVRVRDTKIFCGRLVRESDVRVRRFSPSQEELLAVSVQLNLQTLEYFTFLEGN